jgi:hypothetical protein
MFGFVLATTLFACAEAPLGGDTGDTLQEWWSCEHVETHYSALVVAETTVDEDWSSIEFMIYDDDQFHSLNLFDYGDGLWRVETNLMDLDCHSDGLGGDFAYHK